MIYDEIAARYPGVFGPPPQQRQGCDHGAQFAQLHQHIDQAAALQHRHLHHVEETIMAAIDDLRAQADQFAQNVDNTVIPALDALMAAVHSAPAGVPEADVAAVATQMQDTNARLLTKAQEAAAAVGGAG